jgi:hypothetical protein
MAPNRPPKKPRGPAAKPLANPFNPRYVSSKEKAQSRAERLRFLYWLAVALPVMITVMLFGYTDQAPAGLRAATEQVDSVFGYPVLRLIAFMMS